ncbi:MAG: alpha/beta hydrolase [Proteobacteria bacterium]|nr:alpha/beta hydrolase [Pseudomonadota bacterium]
MRIMDGLDPLQPLPAYARRIDLRGGGARRRLLHAWLHLTVKRIPLQDTDVAKLRAITLAWDARLARPDPQVRRRLVEDGDMRGEWLEVPGSRADRTLLYLHGGAFMFRFPEVHARLVARLCRRLQARAFMVDYRLAPEHPHPAAADDCERAYRWLVAGGADPGRVVLAGDSAGGNLALVLLQRLLGAGEPLPACAVLLSPVVDFTLSSRSLLSHEATDPMFSLAGLVAMRARYAPPERFLDPDVSPLFGRFAGLPPLLFQVGAIEMLSDEAARAAARAHAEGVEVELEVWERMAHVFHALPLPQARGALDHAARFIAKHARWAPVPP